MIEDVIDEKIAAHMTGDVPDNYDLTALTADFKGLFLNGTELDVPTREEMEKVSPAWAKEILMRCAMSVYERKEKEYGPIMREVERVVLLGEVDRKWMDHIDAMDELRKGIGLRAIGQRDPVIEYKFEGYEMFDAMTRAIKEDTVRKLFLVRITQGAAPKREQVAKPGETPSEDGKGKTVQNKKKKIGPNEPCPCGSGLKYKKCCGKNAR
jgi:preprotein translocase subunit SecA